MKERDNLFFDGNGASVDHLGRVLDDALDLSLGTQVLDGATSEGATDLHTIGDDGRSDDLVVGNFLHHLVVGGLIEDASVGELVSDLENYLKTEIIELCFTFPLDHFFLDFFPPPEAAFAFASFDFCGALAIFTVDLQV